MPAGEPVFDAQVAISDAARSARLAEAPVVIRALGLTKQYAQGAMVLRGIDVTVQEGETVALIGSNGAGKSTLLKCLVGLHPVTGGELDVFGLQPKAHAALSAIRSQVGFVFQNHGLVKRQSVLSNVIHGHLGMPGAWRALHAVIAPPAWRQAAMEALDAVNLADKAPSRADRLSGGQSQRVAIARALVRRPRLMIADEPAASLDPAAGHDVMAAFRDVAEAHHMTLLYTTHDMEHALSYARRVIALKDGAIVIDAPTASLSLADLERVFR